jgi:hypothetical protein
MTIQRLKTATILAWNADIKACEEKSLTYFSVGGSTFWLASDATDDDIIAAAYRTGASEANETTTPDKGAGPMTPMTIAEFVKQDSITGRETEIDPMGYATTSPFIVNYKNVAMQSAVVLTDLPALADLPKASASRAWVAYLKLYEVTDRWLFALRACMYNVEHDRNRDRKETIQLLRDVMAPKEFFAAVYYLNEHMSELDEAIARRLAAVASGQLAA